jgi:hypothetical protein
MEFLQPNQAEHISRLIYHLVLVCWQNQATLKMTSGKPVKLLISVLILFSLILGIMSINHPIILKWVIGSASHHGTAMPALVYADGQAKKDIHVFYTDEENNYLICLAALDTSDHLRFLNINLNDKTISIPVTISSTDYDLIAGHLFQSERGKNFSSIQTTGRDSNFDPQLSFAGEEIIFNMPPNKLKIESIRIVLP